MHDGKEASFCAQDHDSQAGKRERIRTRVPDFWKLPAVFRCYQLLDAVLPVAKDQHLELLGMYLGCRSERRSEKEGKHRQFQARG